VKPPSGDAGSSARNLFVTRCIGRREGACLEAASLPTIVPAPVPAPVPTIGNTGRNGHRQWHSSMSERIAGWTVRRDGQHHGHHYGHVCFPAPHSSDVHPPAFLLSEPAVMGGDARCSVGGRCRRSVPQNMSRLEQLNQQNQQMLVSHLLHSLHIPLHLLTGPTGPIPPTTPLSPRRLFEPMDRTGKVGCGRGVHTAHAQYYSMLISLKLPGSNTLCATHAKGTGRVLPSLPVSGPDSSTQHPFFSFIFPYASQPPATPIQACVSLLLPSQYKALPSSGDFCSATCNPLPLNCSYNLCHFKLANNTRPALLFLSVREK